MKKTIYFPSVLTLLSLITLAARAEEACKKIELRQTITDDRGYKLVDRKTSICQDSSQSNQAQQQFDQLITQTQAQCPYDVRSISTEEIAVSDSETKILRTSTWVCSGHQQQQQQQSATYYPPYESKLVHTLKMVSQAEVQGMPNSWEAIKNYKNQLPAHISIELTAGEKFNTDLFRYDDCKDTKDQNCKKGLVPVIAHCNQTQQQQQTVYGYPSLEQIDQDPAKAEQFMIDSETYRMNAHVNRALNALKLKQYDLPAGTIFMQAQDIILVSNGGTKNFLVSCK